MARAPLPPSAYKTRKEYRWAKRVAGKEKRALIRPYVLLGMVPPVVFWIVTGHLLIAAGLAVAVRLLLGLLLPHH